MFNWRIKRLREAVLVLLMLTVLMTGTSFAAEFFLRAEAVNKTMPDGTVVAMWGYALDTTFGGGEGGAATVPGPPLVVPPGDTTITIHLDNNLTEPTSIVIPGQITAMTPTWNSGSPGARTSLTQRVRSFTHETAAGNGAPVDYTWTNVKPGTFLYHSGAHPQVQVQMGLYGAVKIDAAANNVYNDASSAYTNEVTLLYSEIDPALHEAVDTGNYGPGMAVTSTVDYAPKYFLINGEPYAPGSAPIAAGNGGETLLIRFLNAGLKRHVPMLEGQYMTVIAEDGNLYPFAKEQYSVYLPPLKTMDAVLTPAAGYIPVYDRAMHLTNAGASPGGMLTFLSVAAATQYQLDVTVPSGNGTVVTTSAPGGINCGTDCSELYNAGTEVMLGAEPDASFYFFGWSGDCTAAGECSVTMDSAHAVAATFVPSQPFGVGVFRTGTWYLDSNRSGTFDGVPTDTQYSFGLATDIPVSGDWNNDGNTEVGVFRDGTWVLDMNGNGILEAWPDVTVKFGKAGDKPVTGDWNGDGITDVGVVRNKTWFLDSDGVQGYNPATDTSVDFGLATDIPVTGDWDNDINHTTNIGVFRKGWWYLDSDGVQGWDGVNDTSLKFGISSDIPITGDWNGDGTTDVGVFRGNGFWYLDSDGVQGFNAGTDAAFKFGKTDDIPVSGHW